MDDDNKVPVQPVTAWELALWPAEHGIIFRPYSQQPGSTEIAGPRYALSAPAVRRLVHHLSESLRLLEAESLQVVQQDRSAPPRSTD